RDLRRHLGNPAPGDRAQRDRPALRRGGVVPVHEGGGAFASPVGAGLAGDRAESGQPAMSSATGSPARPAPTTAGVGQPRAIHVTDLPATAQTAGIPPPADAHASARTVAGKAGSCRGRGNRPRLPPVLPIASNGGEQATARGVTG